MHTQELIIGSTALKHHFPNFKRQPKDLDIAVSEERKNEGNTEYLYNPVILKYQDKGYLNPSLLLTLKISHLFWETNWDKHMFDTQFLLREGIKYDEIILLELKAFWEEYLPKIRRSNLDQGKGEFFTNNINADEHEHDFLHTQINSVPMYTRILKEDCEVELDQEKWNCLSKSDKLLVVREEVEVMAAERYPDIHASIAHSRQLKVCIRKHFPHYISLFAIENFIELLKYSSGNIEKLRLIIKTRRK